MPRRVFGGNNKRLEEIFIDFHDLYCWPNIIRQIKARRLG
jgi:hypothetical protein